MQQAHQMDNEPFFDDCRTMEEIKRRYHDLAMQHHPDRGGDTATMQQINAEYAFVSARATRQEKPGKTEAEYTDLAAVNERIRAALEALAGLAGLDIEICGLWVWVAGDTRPNKDALKAAGYHWASQKQRWYFAGVQSSSRGAYSMDEIRDRYGSRKYRNGRPDDDRRPTGTLR